MGTVQANPANGLLVDQFGTNNNYGYGNYGSQDFAVNILNQGFSFPVDCKGLYQNFYEASSIDPNFIGPDYGSFVQPFIDTRCRFREIWRSCESGRLFEINSGSDFGSGGPVKIEGIGNEFGVQKKFGRTCVIESSIVYDQTNSTTTFTAEELDSCFTYWCDYPENETIEQISTTNYWEFKIAPGPAFVSGQYTLENDYSQNCFVCTDTSPLCMNLPEAQGGDRILIYVEHGCLCEIDSVYGRGRDGYIEAISPVSYQAQDVDSEGSQSVYNCDEKLQLSFYATQDQIDEIVEGGGYFAVDHYITPDGIAVGTGNLLKLIEVTSLTSNDDYSYLNLGQIRTVGSTLYDALIGLPQEDQSLFYYGGECIYEYFQGCNSGKYYHIWSDIWSQTEYDDDGGQYDLNDINPKLSDGSYYRDYTSGVPGWRINGRRLRNGWLGSGDRKPTMYNVKVPGCVYNDVDGFDKLPRPENLSQSFNQPLYKYYENFEGNPSWRPKCKTDPFFQNPEDEVPPDGDCFGPIIEP